MKHDYCVACGNKENLHQHHLVPKAVGGSDAESNLITLCGECHSKVHGNRSKWNTSELTSAALQQKLQNCEWWGYSTANQARENGHKTQSNVATKMQPSIQMYRNAGNSFTQIAKLLNDMVLKPCAVTSGQPNR